MLACGGVLGSECDEAVDSNKEFMDRLVMGFICKDSALHVRDEGFLSGKYCRTGWRCRCADAGPNQAVGLVSSFGICVSVSSHTH
jgi:hypothetical protein